MVQGLELIENMDGKVPFAYAGGLENVHAAVTDKALNKNFAKKLTRKGIKLLWV